MKEHYATLEQQAAETVVQAKRAAGIFDCGIWELPSGRYIALPKGIVVPRGSLLIAKRVTPRGRWMSLPDVDPGLLSDRIHRQER